MEQKSLLLMIAAFVCVAALAIGGLYLYVSPSTQVLSTTKPDPTNNPVTTPKLEPISDPPQIITPKPVDTTQLYSLINAYRKENKLSILQIHTSLEQSAARKLQDMITTKYWRHQDQQGVIKWQFFQQAGYHYKDAGENLSFGNNTPWSIFSSWVASPAHNQQLLNSAYEDMGAAIDCTAYQEVGEIKCLAVLHLGTQQY